MLLATFLFLIYYVFFVCWFSPSDSVTSENIPAPVYPEQVFQIIDEFEAINDNEESEENEKESITLDTLKQESILEIIREFPYKKLQAIAKALRKEGVISEIEKIGGKGITNNVFAEYILRATFEKPELIRSLLEIENSAKTIEEDIYNKLVNSIDLNETEKEHIKEYHTLTYMLYFYQPQFNYTDANWHFLFEEHQAKASPEVRAEIKQYFTEMELASERNANIAF